VLPTVIEPLREEWRDAQAAALTLAAEGDGKAAIAELLKYHHRLCSVRVLDPACGSGNFLYVTLEHLKRLEGEVLNALDELGHRQTGLALGNERADASAGETVDPHNLLGIEINPRAAAIAEVVLWIGYLQWHFRTRGDVSPPTPVIRDFRNIECRDAVLAYDRVEFVTDERGVPVTRWDGKTMKPSPVTGEPIPDDSARVPVERYVNPRKAEWPEADFVVGNPPFIGKLKIREALGDGYVDALRSAWEEVPDSADFVMYWWHCAAALATADEVEAFGFITTNSLRQNFNRRVIERFLVDTKEPLSLVFAIADHPWVEAGEGADVRVSMTVGRPGIRTGVLEVPAMNLENPRDQCLGFVGRRGKIHSDLRIGVDVLAAKLLRSNSAISATGVIPHGSGMTVTGEVALTFGPSAPVRDYRNGKDIASTPRRLKVIDCYGLSESEVRDQFPALYQWLLTRVKPERDANKDVDLREKWWLHRRSNEEMRRAIHGLGRYAVTVMTSKHRYFQFLEQTVLPDQMLVVFGTEDAFDLGVLSSSTHLAWSLIQGSHLGVGNDPRYNKRRCFETFPFPHLRDEGTLVLRIRRLGEQLDAHRKRQQAAHPELTLTGMYNVLEKLRSGEPLTAKERVIHEQGLVSVLRQIHDELDAAVLAAYGWADLLTVLRVAHGNDAPAEGQTRDDAKRAFEEAVLERLVALNAERAAAEARGEVLWLRPEFQNPSAQRAPAQAEIDTDTGGDEDAADEGEPGVATTAAIKPTPWPKEPVAQVRAVAELLSASRVPMTVDDIAARFTSRGPWKKRLPALLDMLAAVGRVERSADAGWRFMH